MEHEMLLSEPLGGIVAVIETFLSSESRGELTV